MVQTILIGTGIISAVAYFALPHEDDHKLLVDSISEMLGVDLDAEQSSKRKAAGMIRLLFI